MAGRNGRLLNKAQDNKERAVKACMEDLFSYYQTCANKEDWNNYKVLCGILKVEDKTNAL